MVFSHANGFLLSTPRLDSMRKLLCSSTSGEGHRLTSVSQPSTSRYFWHLRDVYSHSQLKRRVRAQALCVAEAKEESAIHCVLQSGVLTLWRLPRTQSPIP